MSAISDKNLGNGYSEEPLHQGEPLPHLILNQGVISDLKIEVKKNLLSPLILNQSITSNLKDKVEKREDKDETHNSRVDLERLASYIINGKFQLPQKWKQALLYFAVISRNTDNVAAALIKLNDDEKLAALKFKDENGDIPLMRAAKQKDYDTVNLLLGHYDLNEAFKMLAVARKREGRQKFSVPIEMAILKRLRSCDTEELFNKNASGKTPLHFAVEMGLKDASGVVLERLGDNKKYEVLNAVDGDGCTPLMRAAKQEDHGIFDLLLRQYDLNEAFKMLAVTKKRADIQDKEFVTFFEESILRRLRSCNAKEFFNKTASGRTPLHFVVEMGLKDAVAVILDRLSYDEKKKALNAKDGNGDNPLMVAAKQKKYDMVSFLLSFQIPIRKVNLTYVQQLLKDANGSESPMKGLSCDYDEIVADGFYLYGGTRKVVRITEPSDVERRAMLCILPKRYQDDRDTSFLYSRKKSCLKQIYQNYEIVLYRFDRGNPVANDIWKVVKLARRVFPAVETMVIHGHGDSHTIETDLPGLTERDFQDGTFSGFKCVILHSCSTGREDEHGNCLAKRLSLKPGSRDVSFYAASDNIDSKASLFVFGDIFLSYKFPAVVPSEGLDIREILKHVSVCYKNGERLDVLGKTPLMQAIANTSASEDDVLKLLELCDIKELFKTDFIGMTAFHYAVIRGDQRMVDEILKKLSDIDRNVLYNMKNWRGNSPLDTAKAVDPSSPKRVIIPPIYPRVVVSPSALIEDDNHTPSLTCQIL